MPGIRLKFVIVLTDDGDDFIGAGGLHHRRF
jgi:hypothetical protein